MGATRNRDQLHLYVIHTYNFKDQRTKSFNAWTTTKNNYVNLREHITRELVYHIII
jgi:hypothetical protein